MRDRKRDIQVLLVEDDPMVQEVNRMFIEKVDGFSVVGVASSGELGKQQVEKLKPDLVLLDVYMPGIDGVELIKQLREELVDVDIIAVTAANDTTTVKTLLRYGVVDYVVKPFTFERLEKALNQYKNTYRRLNHIEKVSQEKLDRIIIQQDYEKPDVTLPKGLHAHTLSQINDYLKGMKTAKSAEEIGSDVGLARVTVRRYLNYLESIGQVEMELTYGTIGRPIQLYRLKQ
ncbi:response regulator [Alkalihalobacterium elongatum]|uniref:response regulator n=1 Tax=Alkalihalobacterium elongatum TaxID=2675466 RepID=UPI001C1FDC05|nr:response regulator [Alkalihalobacterium elongatum]